MMKSGELWQWGAVELASAIRARKVSAREAVESCLRRIEAVNPRINAIVELMADDALRDAERADEAVGKGMALGLLQLIDAPDRQPFDVIVDYAHSRPDYVTVEGELGEVVRGEQFALDDGEVDLVG